MLTKKLMFLIVFGSLQCAEFGLAEDGASPTEAERTAVKQLASKGAIVQIDGDFSVTSITLGSGLNNRVADEDLKLLESFSALRSLTLTGGRVTDSGLKHLERLTSLKTLSLRGTSATSEGIAALQQALPDCRISGFGNTSFGAAREALNGNSSLIRPTTLQTRIANRDVQNELKLSDEQMQNIQTILESLKLNISEYQKKLLAATTEEERQAIRNEMRRKVESVTNVRRGADDAIRKLLSTDQLTRLDQIVLQSRGVSALIDAQVVEQLNLSRDQLRRIAEALTPSGSSRVRPIDMRIRAILTEEQQAKWSEMTGLQFRTTGPGVAPPRSPQPAKRSPLPGKTPKETAEYWFDQFDRDSDDKLTSQEWQRSRNIRGDFTNAGVDLSQPMTRDEFVAHYLRIRHPD